MYPLQRVHEHLTGLPPQRRLELRSNLFRSDRDHHRSRFRYPQIQQGSLYPALPRIREISARIAAEVAQVAYRRGLAARQAPSDVSAFAPRPVSFREDHAAGFATALQASDYRAP
jgi:hypothetical protein